MNCIKCQAPVEGEYERCDSCKTEHQKLCERLDATPRPIVEKKPVEWVKRSDIKDGVVVTTYMTREEAALMGVRV